MGIGNQRYDLYVPYITYEPTKDNQNAKRKKRQKTNAATKTIIIVK